MTKKIFNKNNNPESKHKSAVSLNTLPSACHVGTWGSGITVSFTLNTDIRLTLLIGLHTAHFISWKSNLVPFKRLVGPDSLTENFADENLFPYPELNTRPRCCITYFDNIPTQPNQQVPVTS